MNKEDVRKELLKAIDKRTSKELNLSKIRDLIEGFLDELEIVGLCDRCHGSNDPYIDWDDNDLNDLIIKINEVI